MIVCKNPGSLWFWSHADLWKHKNCEKKKHDSWEVLSSFIKNNLYKCRKQHQKVKLVEKV